MRIQGVISLGNTSAKHSIQCWVVDNVICIVPKCFRVKDCMTVSTFLLAGMISQPNYLAKVSNIVVTELQVSSLACSRHSLSPTIMVIGMIHGGLFLPHCHWVTGQRWSCNH